MTRVLPGRLPPEGMYPAGEAGIVVRSVVLRSGARLRVLEAGDQRGEPVVFVHGWGGSVYSFRRNLPVVAAAGYRAVALDLPGHGLSDKPSAPAAYSVRALRGAVLEVLDVLGLSRVALVGHSMGASLALGVALDAPARVAALALLAPVGWCAVRYHRFATYAASDAFAALAPHVVRRWVVGRILRAAYGRVARFTERDVDEYWAPSQFPEFVGALRILLREFDWAPFGAAELAAVTAPTLVMFGALDPLLEATAGARAVAHFAGATARTVEGAGHVIAEEAPEVVNAALLAHLGAERGSWHGVS